MTDEMRRHDQPAVRHLVRLAVDANPAAASMRVRGGDANRIETAMIMEIAMLPRREDRTCGAVRCGRRRR